MPKLPSTILTVLSILENDTVLAEALLYPEVVRYGSKPGRLRDVLEGNAEAIAAELDLLALHRRALPLPARVVELEFEIAPPKRSIAWRDPVVATIRAVAWRHGDQATIAYVPALGIEVLARNDDELAQRLRSECRAHLFRIKGTASYEALVWQQRTVALEIEPREISLDIATPKRLAAKSREEKKKPVINEVGRVLSQETLAESYEMDDVVGLLAEALSGRRLRSVLLVGPSGVGKTAAVHELVRRRTGLGRAPVWATSGARLVAGMSGFGMWQERCQRLIAEAGKERAILYLGNLIELMEVGKSADRGQGIAAFLRPRIASGEITVIAECTPEQIAAIEREDPRLLEAFFRIDVPEPDIARGRKILRQFASKRSLRRFEEGWLEELDRLHRRWVTYSAYPGRPIRFLRNLLDDARADDATITAKRVIHEFARETGLPLFLLDDDVPLDLNATRLRVSSNVIGQQGAVDLVVDVLAAVKAGLTRPRKPIASMMFIGPTGVGKTEMAKALAELLFGDRERLVRFDMSEYSDALSAERLIGGAWGAEGRLTASVREQPFSVVLLDEFEKAHPAVFDLLLQALGEGRLTDRVGRTADFTNSVVIMTSNLGAETYRTSGLGFGSGVEQSERAARHFEDAVRGFVRPEFFNRIDRVVAFAPLDRDTIEMIARRELGLVELRDGIRLRGVEVDYAEGVAARLAASGYDPRYGARPLKRSLERELLVPLADELNRAPTAARLVASVRTEGDGIAVRVKAPPPSPARLDRVRNVALQAARCSELRRDLQAVESGPATATLRNDIARLARLQSRLAKRRHKNPADLERLASLPDLLAVRAEVEAALADSYALEDAARLAAYGKREIDLSDAHTRLEAERSRWHRLVLRLYGLRFANADRITLALYGDSIARVRDLARAYYHAAHESGGEVLVGCVVLKGPQHAKLPLPDENGKPVVAPGAKAVVMPTPVPLVREMVEEPVPFLRNGCKGLMGVLMQIDGPLARPRFEPERGIHAFTNLDHRIECAVLPTEVPLADYIPPAGAGRQGGVTAEGMRRIYDAARRALEDPIEKTRTPWSGGDLEQVLAAAIEDTLLKRALAYVTGDRGESE